MKLRKNSNINIYWNGNWNGKDYNDFIDFNVVLEHGYLNLELTEGEAKAIVGKMMTVCKFLDGLCQYCGKEFETRHESFEHMKVCPEQHNNSKLYYKWKPIEDYVALPPP